MLQLFSLIHRQPTIDEIYDKVSEEDIVLDYIDQCNQIFKKFGKEPHIDDYPENFKRFLDMYGEHMEFCQIQLNYLDYEFQ